MKPILIFDLDGTILSVNSFPLWVKYLLKGQFGGLNVLQRMRLTSRVTCVMLERKLLKKSHYHAKRKLQKLFAEALEKDDEKLALLQFADQLIDTIRPNMLELLEGLETDFPDAMLATAAAAEYAHPFAQMLGFKHIITTPYFNEKIAFENVGEAKRDSVLAYLKGQGWQDRPRIFFTDHEEDMPLIQASHHIFWLGDDAMLERVNPQADGVEMLDAKPLTASEIQAGIT